MRESSKNLAGLSFGLLAVKGEYKPEEPKKYRMWVVQCSCGKEKAVREDSLLAGRVKSCGCASTRFRKSKMEKRYNLANKRFGSLWVVWRSGSEKSASGSSHSLWVCKCDCGNMVTVKGGYLSSGRVQSCGCVGTMLPDVRLLKAAKDAANLLERLEQEQIPQETLRSVRAELDSALRHWETKA